MSVIKINIAILLPSIVVSLRNLSVLEEKKLTPKYNIEAPISVALCPPLGHGGTPSI
jgi:hypothetical protein